MIEKHVHILIQELVAPLEAQNFKMVGLRRLYDLREENSIRATKPDSKGQFYVEIGQLVFMRLKKESCGGPYHNVLEVHAGGIKYCGMWLDENFYRPKPPPHVQRRLDADKIERGFDRTRRMWEIMDVIVAEFESDPSSVACFDLRIVEEAKQLVNTQRKEAGPMEPLYREPKTRKV